MNHTLTQTTINGITVIHITVPELPVSVVSAWYRAGSRFDPPNKLGLAHFFEHLLTSETDQFPKKIKRLQYLESQGIDSNAFTSKETAHYYHIQPQEMAAKSLSILLEGIQNTRFSEESLEHEKAIILEETSRNWQDPDSYLWQLSNAGLWGETNDLGRNFFGTEESIKSITLQDVSQFYETYYKAPSALVAINFGEAEAYFDQVRKEYSTPSNQQLITLSPAQFTGQKMIIDDRKSEHATIGINIPTTSLKNDAQKIIIPLLADYLAGFWSSKLNKALRLEHNLTYWVSQYTEYFSDIGLIRLSFSVPTKDIEPSLAIAEKELDTVWKQGLAEPDFQAIKKMNTLNSLLDTSPTDLLYYYGSQAVLLSEPLVPLTAFLDQVKEATINQVSESAALYLGPDNRCVAIIR